MRASDLLMQIARSIAGKERSTWIDAMAAESASIDGDNMAWAFGCVWASIKERVRAERWFLGAIVSLPVATIVLQQILFFPLVWGIQVLGLPMETFVWIFMCMGVPFGFFLGRRMPARRAMVATLLCGVILAWLGVVFFWIMFGQGPEIWFTGNSHVYDMTPVLGWSANTLLWVAGAGIGGLTRRSPPKRIISG